jgi:hypothetical protein
MRSRRILMKTWIVVLALAVAASSALAQPQQPPLNRAPEDPPVDPQPPQPPPPPNNPQPPQPPVVNRAPDEPAEFPQDDIRPSAFSIALGVGYVFPTSLESPNITSARFRLPAGLTFEPQVSFVNATREVDTGTSVQDDVRTVEISALGRFPIMKRGRVDLEILGGLSITSISEQPDAPDSDRTTTTFAAVYGLGIGAWITTHWQLSFSALNPIVASSKIDEELGPGTSTVTNNTAYGLVWDPAIMLMIHLYN